jgi:hypothetical protein
MLTVDIILFNGDVFQCNAVLLFNDNVLLHFSFCFLRYRSLKLKIEIFERVFQFNGVYFYP